MRRFFLKTILLFSFFLVIGCSTRAIKQTKNWYIADDIFKGLITGETSDGVRWRLERFVEKISEDLDAYNDCEKIVIDSLFENQDFLQQDILAVRKELRSHIKPGKATDELQETAKNLKEIFTCINRDFDLHHALDVGEFLFMKGQEN
jgi:hypothetical protein